MDSNDYGPSPAPPSSPERKGGYFTGLRSNLYKSPMTEKSKNTNGTSSRSIVSPLSLISDLYDDFEDHDPSRSNIKEAIAEGIASLPPLRSKFVTDDDDGDFSQVFLHSPSHHQSHKSTKSNPNIGGNGTPSSSSSASASGGISFSIMNKKQVIQSFSSPSSSRFVALVLISTA